jgi:hypothetical protein
MLSVVKLEVFAPPENKPKSKIAALCFSENAQQKWTRKWSLKMVINF